MIRIMARFSDHEAEIKALAHNMVTGLAVNMADFPPPLSNATDTVPSHPVALTDHQLKLGMRLNNPDPCRGVSDDFRLYCRALKAEGG